MSLHSVEPRKVAYFSIVLTAIIMIVYAQVGNHQFINLDDTGYVTLNSNVAGGLTSKSAWWAFTTIDCFYWQPLTWLSHMADVQLYGMNPRGHHLTSVAIHCFASLLVLVLFSRATGDLWSSAFVAFLFALHPQSVESVAWAAERKDVLSAFFWVLTLILYVEFTAKRKASLYLLSLCSFMSGLMSKPMVVSLPIILLLFDYWPLGRFDIKGYKTTLKNRLHHITPVILEKIPFIVCSIFSVAITLYGHNLAGGLRHLDDVSLVLRIENALVSYVAYIEKMFLPLGLAVLYPFPTAIAFWKVFGSLCILLLITIFTIRVRQNQPYLVVGWFWFLLTLVPVIGLFQTGEQAMADRFSYIPRIGLLIMVTWGVSDLTKAVRSRRGLLTLAASIVLIASTVLTWRQLGYWRDNISLYEHTLQLTTDNFTIHNNFGLALAEEGNLQAAIEQYREALRIKPKNAFSHNNLGMVLVKQGNIEAAIREYEAAILISPAYAIAHNNLGIALASRGDLDAALRKYEDALRINPEYVDAHYNRGLAFAGKGEFDAAISEYQNALRITPNDIDIHMNLGTALAGKGQLDLAIRKFQEILMLRPNNALAQSNLQVALTQKRMQEGSGRSKDTSGGKDSR